MFQAGLLASYASHWLGPENLRGYSVRFREQVWPGDVLDFTGRVIELSEGPSSVQVRVGLECRRQTGAVAVTAAARFVIDPNATPSGAAPLSSLDR
jgi:hypothetical protein